MSLGAQMAGIDVRLAIEKDPHATITYSHNHPNTTCVVDDIANVMTINVSKKDRTSILFGGPPCQGFSTSNQRTRSISNPSNWLFNEFIRISRIWKPDWIVFENVRGIIETERGFFRDLIITELDRIGYTSSFEVLCASDFGVPQIRSRFFLVASRHGMSIRVPKSAVRKRVTVRQAIGDLPSLPNGASEDYLPYPCKPLSRYARELRNGQAGCRNHIVTNNAPHILERYKHIPQGGNWENIPKRLLRTYTHRSRCHTGIYRRLCDDRPSVVLGNYRKNMLVHPWENRGLSVREAARLQSFPDAYEFLGSIGFKQQQVANAVPPLLAKSVFNLITEI